MDTKKKQILVKATGQGFSIAIHGKKDASGEWQCAVEKNEITFPDTPDSVELSVLEEQRHYEMSEFIYSFEEAFRIFDHSEWFLCHPGSIHEDFTDFVLEAFEDRMQAYESQNPIDSSMEQFIIDNKKKEWRKTTAAFN